MATDGSDTLGNEEKEKKVKSSERPGYIVCERCGRSKRDIENFYKGKDGERVPICKDCLYENLETRDPRTFFWVLQRMDVPYVEDSWLSVSQKTYLRDPIHFKPGAVLGSYVRVMMAAYWRGYSWNDTLPLNEQKGSHFTAKWSRAKIDKAFNDRLKRELKSEKITEAEFESRQREVDKAALRASETYEKKGEFRPEKDKALMLEITESLNREIFDEIPYPERGDEAGDYLRIGKSVAPVNEDPISAVIYTAKRIKQKEEEELAAAQAEQAKAKPPEDELSPDTDKDKVSEQPEEEAVPEGLEERENYYMSKMKSSEIAEMALKWGDNYSPSEWLRMEDVFQKYADDYEMNVDREETLKKMCRASLEMDRALEAQDSASYSRLATVFDQLRKSAKFTEVQKKEEVQKDLDSVGELVDLVEQKGGIIRNFDVGYGKKVNDDKVDLTIKDMKAYVYNLVKNEMGLGDIIETYIRKLEESSKEKDVPLGSDLHIESAEAEEEKEANAWANGLASSVMDEADELLDAAGKNK